MLNTRIATTNRQKFNYFNWKNSKPDIVLIHGLASNLHIWELVGELLSREFNVIAYDQRGHGLSDKPLIGYDFDSITEDLLSLCISLNLSNPIIVGHSWGANVVIEALAKDEGKYYQGGILVDGGILNIYKDSPSLWADIELNLSPPNLEHLSIDELIGRVQSNQSGYWYSVMENVLRSSFDVVDNHIKSKLSRGNHMTILNNIWAQNIKELLIHIKSPVLILPVSQGHGVSHSPNMHGMPKIEAVDLARSLLAKSTVEWIYDSIHDVPIQNPNAVSKAIIKHKSNLFFV